MADTLDFAAMLGKVFRKLDRKLLVVGLIAHAAIAVGLLCWQGWRTGGVLALLFFVVTNGPGLLWELSTARLREDVAAELEDRDRRTFSDNSRNNPTIR